MQPKRLATCSVVLSISGPVLAVGAWFLVCEFSPQSIPIEGISFLVEAALLAGTPPLAILLGVAAIRKMGKSDIPVPGRRVAMAGLVIGAFGVLLACIAVPRIVSVRDTMERARCCNNLWSHSVAKDIWAYQHKATDGTPVSLEELKPFKCYNYGHCPTRPWVEYAIGRIGEPERCPIHGDRK